jgi:hypothetical protein
MDEAPVVLAPVARPSLGDDALHERRQVLVELGREARRHPSGDLLVVDHSSPPGDEGDVLPAPTPTPIRNGSSIASPGSSTHGTLMPVSRTSAAKSVKPSETSAPKRSRMVEFLERGMDGMDVEALVEAGKVYGDDYERELADIQAGRHPLQRRKPAR